MGKNKGVDSPPIQIEVNGLFVTFPSNIEKSFSESKENGLKYVILQLKKKETPKIEYPKQIFFVKFYRIKGGRFVIHPYSKNKIKRKKWENYYVKKEGDEYRMYRKSDTVVEMGPFRDEYSNGSSSFVKLFKKRVSLKILKSNEDDKDQSYELVLKRITFNLKMNDDWNGILYEVSITYKGETHYFECIKKLNDPIKEEIIKKIWKEIDKEGIIKQIVEAKEKFNLYVPFKRRKYFQSKSEDILSVYNDVVFISDPHINIGKIPFIRGKKTMDNFSKLVTNLGYIDKEKKLFVVTGDITDKGIDLEFYLTGWLFKLCGIDYENVLLLNGNHDVCSLVSKGRSRNFPYLYDRYREFSKMFYGETLPEEMERENTNFFRYYNVNIGKTIKHIVTIDIAKKGEGNFDGGEFYNDKDEVEEFKRDLSNFEDNSVIVVMYHDDSGSFSIRNEEILREDVLSDEDVKKKIMYVLFGHTHKYEVMFNDLKMINITSFDKEFDKENLHQYCFFHSKLGEINFN